MQSVTNAGSAKSLGSSDSDCIVIAFRAKCKIGRFSDLFTSNNFSPVLFDVGKGGLSIAIPREDRKKRNK
jgi:hypothetical protein